MPRLIIFLLLSLISSQLFAQDHFNGRVGKQHLIQPILWFPESYRVVNIFLIFRLVKLFQNVNLQEKVKIKYSILTYRY